MVGNAQVLAETLMKGGLDIVTGGTDTHLMLVDLRPKSVTGKDAEAALGRAHITCNKNGIPFDPQPPTVTSGVRLGTPAGTTRGFGAAEFREIGELIVEVRRRPRRQRSRRQRRGRGLGEGPRPGALRPLPDLPGPLTAMPARLAAVTLLVPDYPAGLGFFVDRLGFTLVEDTDLGGGKRWVLVAPPGGGTRLLLARAATPAQAAAIGNQAGGRVGFFLETDAFDRDHAAFTAAGVAFEESPRDEPYGRVAVFRDPFGNRWDLIGR